MLWPKFSSNPKFSLNPVSYPAIIFLSILYVFLGFNTFIENNTCMYVKK